MVIKFMVVMGLLLLVVSPSYAQRDLDEAIVKIYAVYYSAYDYDMPSFL